MGKANPLEGQLPLPGFEREPEPESVPEPPVYRVPEMDLISWCIDYYNDWLHLRALAKRIEDAVLARGESLKVGKVAVTFSKPSNAPGVSDYRKALEVWQKTATEPDVEAMYAEYGDRVVIKPKDACSALGLEVTGELRPAKASLSVKE